MNFRLYQLKYNQLKYEEDLIKKSKFNLIYFYYYYNYFFFFFFFFFFFYIHKENYILNKVHGILNSKYPIFYMD